MKRTLLLLLLIIAGNAAFSQDYAPLPNPGIRCYFTNSAGYLRGIRVDSVVQESGYKRYVTFRTPRGWKPGTNNTILADSAGACWIGKNVRAYANGDWHFPNRTGDTLLVKTGAAVGDTWIFHRDTSAIWTEAKVLSVDTQTVFGVLDSVKKIQLTVKNGTVALPSNFISSFQVILSKTMGFAQVPDLHLFPYKDLDSAFDKRDFWYRKLSSSNFWGPVNPANLLFAGVTGWNPTEREMYDFGVGDVVNSGHKIINVYSSESLDTVVARQDFPTYTEYTLSKWLWQQYQSPYGPPLSVQHVTTTAKKTDQPTFDTLRMPEEYFSGQYEFLYVNFKDSSLCRRGLLVEQKVGEVWGLIAMYLPFHQSTKYKKGLGMVFYDYADSDGQQIQDGLYSYQKNGIPCGTIPAVPSGIGSPLHPKATFKIYPQPAGNTVYLEAPQLRYPATIRIQNLQGQLLSTQELNASGNPISTAVLPAGLYLLSVTDAGGTNRVMPLLVNS